MSDFLHDLRSGKFKRGDRNNRSYHDPQYKGPHRRGDADGRRGPRPSPHASRQKTAIMDETVSEIKTILQDIAASHKRFVDAFESKAGADERRTDAMESIVELLKHRFPSVWESLEEDRAVPESVSEPVTPAMQDDQAEKTAELDPMQLRTDILDMRKEGMSYDRIAQHLESNGVPTFSGRGKWRGPIVSKFCKEAGQSA